MEFLKKNWIMLLILILVAGYVLSEKYEDWHRHNRIGAGSPSQSSIPETVNLLTSGMSLECLAQSRHADQIAIQRKIEESQQRLATQGILTPIIPTSGPLGERDRLVLFGRPQPRQFPTPSIDILERLGVKLENQFEELAGVTDRAIRGMVDQAYQKTLIADTALRGWTLSVRPVSEASGTFMDEERKVAIVHLQRDRELETGAHEFAHVLSGPAFLNGENIATVAKEYVAIAAETTDPGILREEWTYTLQNLPILGMGRTINGESGVIHSSNAPLDGWRYDALRLTDEMIGEDGQIALAKAIWEQAHKNDSMTMEELEPLFVEHGIRDLTLFRKTLKPGLYLDLAFTRKGVPFVLAKTIDNDGYEGLTPVPEQIVWRDKEGRVIATGDPIPLQPSLKLDGAHILAAYASVLEVRVAGEVYTFRFQDTHQDVNDVTK